MDFIAFLIMGLVGAGLGELLFFRLLRPLIKRVGA